jgi:hypothetical protein
LVPELAVIRYLLSSDKYKKFSRFVDVPKELREVKVLHHCLRALHEKFPDKDHSIDELEVILHSSYPNMKTVEKEAYSLLLEELRKVEVKDEVLQDVLRDVAARSRAREIALASFEVSEGRKAFEELATLFSNAQESDKDARVSWESSRNFVTDDLFEIEKHTIKGPGLRWRLKWLNRSLGPLRAGDFGFIFARPESGKTTFLADQCTYFAEQATAPIVWFNNEEQGEKVRLRTFQASLGIPADELWRDKAKVLKVYRERTKGHLRIYDDASIHRNEVESIVAELNPQVIVFDQIDKVKGFDADRPDLVFGRIYQWARELAKRGCAIIGVCQAGGTGEGVKWLTMSHVAEAHTSKQAEADWILGIGRSNESGTDDIRFLNISKNKLLGDEHTDPNERHGRFEVLMRPMIARYEDLD